MGIETAIALGTTAVGAAMKYGENRSARKRSQQVSDTAGNITSAPLDVTGDIKSKLNTGQDSYLQYLRSNPNALDPFKFDASSAFRDLQAKDAEVINDQSNQLSAGAGSLGSRFGSGFAAKSALLRSRFAADTSARNAGIAQSSFNNALNTGMADFQAGQSRQTQLLDLLSRNELGRRGQQLQGLGLGASQPYPGFGDTLASTGGDVASLLMLMKYLKGNNTSTRIPVNSGAVGLAPPPVNYGAQP